NRRFIRSAYLEHAVRKAYDELISRENYPSWFLFIELDPAQIDINIHPTKTEIKFRDDRMIYAIVHAAVRRALGRFNLVPSLDFEPEPAMIAAFSGGISPAPVSAPAWRPHDLGAFNPPIVRSEGWQQLFGLETETPSAPAAQETVKPRAIDLEEGVSRSVFQLHGLYIAAQLRTGFMLVDQHRA